MAEAFTIGAEPSFQAIIFDCDGTLVDSAAAHLSAYNVALGPDAPSMSWDWYSTRLGIPARELLSQFSSEHKLNIALDDLVRTYDVAFKRDLASIQEITVIADIARAYLGKVPLAVASNGTHGHVEDTLRGAGLLALFSVLVGRDEVAHAKPAPDVYLEAASRLKVPAGSCIVFEDSPEGMLSAQRAGMRAYDVAHVLGATPSLIK